MPPSEPQKKLGYGYFVRYLGAHKLRLAVAFVSMVFVGFFGSFNFLLLKPALEVILGDNRTPHRTLNVARVADDGTSVTVTLNDDGIDPDRVAGDGLYSGYGPLIGGQREWIVVNAAPHRDSVSEAKKRGLMEVGFLQRMKERWDRLVAPIGARVRQWDQRLKDYGRENRMNALWILASLMVGMAVLHGLFDYLANYQMTYTLLDVTRRLKDELFRRVLSQDYLFFVRQTTGYLESRVVSDVSTIRNTADVLLTDAIQMPIRLVFVLLVLIILNLQLTVVCLLLMPFAILPLLYFAYLIRRVTRRQKRQADMLSSSMEESFRNFQAIKCFQSEEIEATRFSKSNMKLFEYFMKRRVARFGASPLMEVVGAVTGAVVMLIGGHLILTGRMEFSTLMVYLITTSQFYTPLRKLSRINNTIQTGRVSADRILEMLQIEPQMTESPNALPLDRIRHSIAFRNVSFSYEDQLVLNDVSFEVPVGKTVAIVGPSGAGKTTLACLLMRLFDPKEGRVEYDGRDAREYRIQDLRRRFAMVTQETVLFNDTVANNIAYPDREPDMERVVQAATLANAHEFILQMDGGKGYETVIGQSGQFLSGGQRQRLAIARAIYRNPDVLVLDEATSSLDEKSQAVVQEAINNLLRGRTAFIIAHRLSTVRNADEILVLEHGRLVERGPHDVLIRRNGPYAALYRMAESTAQEL
ncbi:MAG: ABC transporter ATP-binding protein/permease [Candidatus Sumerlaeia bacterium]|nr:ABC transporter ATP-binding protein/permease [Candidatus Sumerlaeia bacterium]